MKEKRVQSVKDIDFSGMMMPFIAVYRYPDDFPDKIVARVYDLNKPTGTIMVKDRLDEIMNDIRENTEMQFIPRFACDVTSLIGTWI